MRTTTTINLHDGRTIRAALKEQLGYNARQVRVRLEHYSMGQTTHVTVADPDVDYGKVKAFAQQCEHVYLDEATGEILSGGNTFVHVHVTDAVADAWAAPLVGPIATAVAKLKADSEGNPGHGTLVDGLNLIAWSGRWPGEFYLTRRDEPIAWRTCWTPMDKEGIKRAAAAAYRDLGKDVYEVEEWAEDVLQRADQ